MTDQPSTQEAEKALETVANGLMSDATETERAEAAAVLQSLRTQHTDLHDANTQLTLAAERDARRHTKDQERIEAGARALMLFYEHAEPVDSEGFARIASPEPWRAAGRFFDAAYGGTNAARQALKPTQEQEEAR
jgi:hypothetical protein